MKRFRRFWPFSRNTYKGRHREVAYEAAPPHVPDPQRNEIFGRHTSGRYAALGTLALGTPEAPRAIEGTASSRSAAAIGNLAVTVTETPYREDPLTITGEIVKVPPVISTLLREVVVPNHERQPLKTDTVDIRGIPAINRRMMDVIEQERYERAQQLTYDQLNEQADQALSAASNAVAEAYHLDDDTPPLMREAQRAYLQPSGPIPEPFITPLPRPLVRT